jgi:hypothetical protein
VQQDDITIAAAVAKEVPLKPGDAKVVAARNKLITAVTQRLSAPDLTFEQQRDLLMLLGGLRPCGREAMRQAVSRLGLAPPTPLHWWEGTGEQGIEERDQAGVLAAARLGLPVIPELVTELCLGQAGRAGRRGAEQALEKMLLREAKLWVSAVPSGVGFGCSIDLAWVAHETGGLEALQPGESPQLNPQPRHMPPGMKVPPAGEEPKDVYEGVASSDPAAITWAFITADGHREDDMHDLSVRVADTRGDAADRRSAAAALGLIRAEYQEFGEQGAGKALVKMLAEEDVQPGKPLDEMKTPAALALVRIDIPDVPILTETIATSNNAKLRSNCAGVMTVMLGKYAKPWLEDVVNDYKTQTEKGRLQEQIAKWGPYCTGEGYWEEQNKAG